MARTFAQENARLRREIALLRRAGQQRDAALFDAVHVKGPDVASAATITLNDPYCDITGTTTITAIAERPLGDIRRVCFQGILTLTHNATSLILPGAANITTQVGDQAELISLGSGNWQCRAYQRADGYSVALQTLDDIQLDRGTLDFADLADLTAATGESLYLDQGAYDVAEAIGIDTVVTFGTLPAGNIRRIRFKYATRLYSGTKITVPAGMELAYPGDIAEFLSLGSGNYRLVSLQRANPASMNVGPSTSLTGGRLYVGSNAYGNTDTSASTSISFGAANGCWIPVLTIGGMPTMQWVDPVPATSGLFVRLTDTTQSATTVNGSPNLTGLTSTAGLITGMNISGTNIPGGATISNITSATAITISANATGSGTNTVTITAVTGKNYDLFIVDPAALTTSGGTAIGTAPTISGLSGTASCALRLGPAWTSDTARNAAISFNSLGYYHNTAAITANPYYSIPAGYGHYVGTIRTSTAGNTADTVLKRFVWSMYNRVPRKLKVTDTTDSWPYTTATWRQANNSSANQVEWVVGLNENVVELRVHGLANNATNNVNAATGIGIDSTTVNSADVYGGSALTTGMSVIPAQYIGYPGLGYHYAAWLEISAATGTTNWRGDNGLTYQQSGMVGTVWC